MLDITFDPSGERTARGVLAPPPAMATLRLAVPNLVAALSGSFIVVRVDEGGGGRGGGLHVERD